MYGFISGFSILFHWFIFLFLCQCHTVLMIVALFSNLRSGSLIPSTLFFFHRLLWLFGVFCVSIQILRFFILVLKKMPLVIWYGIALSLCFALGGRVILTLLIVAIQEHGISFHLCHFQFFFYQLLNSFGVQVFCLFR